LAGVNPAISDGMEDIFCLFLETILHNQVMSKTDNIDMQGRHLKMNKDPV